MNTNKNEDENFAKALGKIQEAIMQNRKNGDYILDDANYQKYTTVLGELLKMVKEQDGKIEKIEIEPKQQHAFITVVFNVFEVYGDNIKTFTDMVSKVDVFSIEPLVDGTIRIGININNIFIPKVK